MIIPQFEEKGEANQAVGEPVGIRQCATIVSMRVVGALVERQIMEHREDPVLLQVVYQERPLPEVGANEIEHVAVVRRVFRDPGQSNDPARLEGA
jgi:hypothetical protein